MLTAILLVCARGNAQTKQHLLPLSPAERSGLNQRLDPKLMPEGAGRAKFDPAQVFKLTGANDTELTIVPVVFTLSSAESGIQGFTCGAYILPERAPAYFLDGSPTGDIPVQCWKILAVRLVRHGAQPPDIVITGSDSLTSHSWQQDYILSRKPGQPYTLSVDYKQAP